MDDMLIVTVRNHIPFSRNCQANIIKKMCRLDYINIGLKYCQLSVWLSDCNTETIYDTCVSIFIEIYEHYCEQDSKTLYGHHPESL